MKAFLSILTVLLVGFPVVGAARARSPEAPTWLMGDTWTYRLPTSKTATWRVLGITAEGYAVGIETSDGMTVVHLTSGLAVRSAHEPADTWTNPLSGEMVAWEILGVTPVGYTAAWNRTSDEAEAIDVTPNPALRGVYYFHPEWPLEVGRVWTYTLRGRAGIGLSMWSMMEAVEAQEAVTVPAGTFQAVRIHGRQCDAAQSNRCGDFDVWYAPRVKSFVKIAWRASSYWGSDKAAQPQELLFYQVRPQ